MIEVISGVIYKDGEPVQYSSLTALEQEMADNAGFGDEGTGITVNASPSQGGASTVFSQPETQGFKTTQVLKIKSLISGYVVELKGAFSDIQMNWNSNWNEENVYGRLDPIPTYSGTTRDISLSVELIAPERQTALDASMSLANLQALQVIANMCYPAYDINPNDDLSYDSATLKAAPLLGIKMANIICSSDNGYLKAYMKSFSITHQAKGLYELGVTENVSGTEQTIFYKRMTVNFSFGILHDENVGHRSDGRPFDLENRYPFAQKIKGTTE